MRFTFFLFSLFCFVSPFAAHALRTVEKQVILEKLDDYEMCQGRDYSGDFCHDALLRWVEKHPDDAFTAGKMTRLKMNAWGAIPFFTQAFSKGKGNCKDEDVKLAVVSALNLPASSNKVVVESAKKIGFEKCFSELKVAIVESASLDSYAFQNVCKDLVTKGLISGLKAKKCAEIK